MWINEMMTIWLYGSLLSIILIVILLYVWYKPEDKDR